MLADFHLHTIASDGVLEPDDLVSRVAACGVGRLAITDHETLAAYRWRGGEVFARARSLGVELVVGIELDVALEGREVHVLGLGLDPVAPGLRRHLEAVKQAREQRARHELALVNELMGPGTLEADEVFVAGRDVLMRPHFIRPLVDRGRFSTYGEGRRWFHENARRGVVVPKPTPSEACAMIHAAGGVAVLAHPGYYWKDGLAVLDLLESLRASGLDGVELEYPYASSSPDLFSDADAERFSTALRAAGQALSLTFTRGSDAHFPHDLERVYGTPPAPPAWRAT
jgi:predicted metal-dependent phosphoesterase TrpH